MNDKNRLPLAKDHLQLESDVLCLRCDLRYNNMHVYFKNLHTGKPVKQMSLAYGDGWDILNTIARTNHMDAQQLYADYQPAIFAEKVTFRWH